MKIKTPFSQLPTKAQDELVDYIMAGNDHRDLAVLFLDTMNRDALYGLVGEVKEVYDTEDLKNSAIGKLTLEA